jgi:hypothetical protein
VVFAAASPIGDDMLQRQTQRYAGSAPASSRALLQYFRRGAALAQLELEHLG